MTTTTKQGRSAFDCRHIKSVHAWALVHRNGDDRRGNAAGRIVCNFSDNPAGSVCTATVHIWAGPLSAMANVTGRAGGYGYDKASAAVDSAFRKAQRERADYVADEVWEWLKALDIPHMHGVGMSAIENWLGTLGYVCIQVI